MTCATIEDSNQPAHPRSLISPVNRMCLLQHPGYQNRDKLESVLYWVAVQADLSFRWLHRSFCRFSRALAQLSVQIYLVNTHSVNV